MCPNQISLSQIFVSANVVLVGRVSVRSRVLIVEDPPLIEAARSRKERLGQLNHVLVDHVGRKLIVLESSSVGSEWVIELDSLGQQGAKIPAIFGRSRNQLERNSSDLLPEAFIAPIKE